MESYDCGCSVKFADDGQVKAVEVCDKHKHIFSEHKSLKQMSMDLHHEHLKAKHAKKAEAPKE